MKRIITSAGLFALGAASIQAQYAPGLSEIERTKPWSVSASLRGFYDDNIHTTTSSRDDLKEESFGYQISPSVAVNIPLQQTFVGLSYTYGFTYYENRSRADDKFDQSHQVNGKLSHAFTERYKLDLTDSFVIAQEPEVLAADVPFIPVRSEGDNIRNAFAATFSATLTDLFGVVLGYENRFFDYEQDEDDLGRRFGPFGRFGSFSSRLDRVENVAFINGRWQIQRDTVGVLGYQFQDTDYTSNSALGIGPGLRVISPDVRDSRSHYAYIGADQMFNPTLNGSIRVGAQFIDFHNALPGMDDDQISPYADANLNWTYFPGSYLQLGVRHSRSVTDVIDFDRGNRPTLDAETTTVYGSVNHKITAKLTGSVLAQFQNSRFEEGGADDEIENFLLVGVNVSYDINKFLAAETGYNYDRLDSDLANRSYTRNRVYVGLRATY